MINCSFRVHSDDFYVEIKCKNVLEQQFNSKTYLGGAVELGARSGAPTTERARSLSLKGAEFRARRIYFHNGVVTIVLWFVLVPKECAAVPVEPSGVVLSKASP